jgi:hypothetical protein
MQYKAYIQSTRWRRRRLRYFKKYGRACAACRTEKFVTLHHMSYERFGPNASIATSSRYAADATTSCIGSTLRPPAEKRPCCSSPIISGGLSLSRAFLGRPTN